jgi:hypothetical protein
MIAPAPRLGAAELDSIRHGFGLSEAELAGIFRVSRATVAKWRGRGVPYERAADVDRVLDLVTAYVTHYEPARVPQMVRTAEPALDGKSILETLAVPHGIERVRAHHDAAIAFRFEDTLADMVATEKRRADPLAVLRLDTKRKTVFFSPATTTADIAKVLREPMTERELVDRAIAIGKTDPANFMRLAVLAHSRRMVIEDSARRRKTAEVYGGTRDDTQRVSGAADAAFAKAYDELVAEGIPVTPSRLRSRSHRDFRAAERWLVMNHPEALGASGAAK